MINSLFIILFAPIFSLPDNDPEIKNIGELWNDLDRQIVLRQVNKDSAIAMMREFSIAATEYFRNNSGYEVLRKDWVFPLKNFTQVSHRDDGDDYIDDGYDYFQGSDTKGHPAHDIMILDNNKDLLDDNTGKPVDVVSMSSGVVIATDTTWKEGSYLRGGKYVKIFDVTNKKIFYYSHLNIVTVKPGEIIKAGDKIGEVGRTGRNTILPEGKTHLHIALLRLDRGYPKPEPIIEDIFRAKGKLND
jgi:peptidoglycan LD-endopeptidase LytH